MNPKQDNEKNTHIQKREKETETEREGEEKKILKQPEKKEIAFKEAIEKQSADFSKATMKARTLFNDVFNLPKEKPRSSRHGKYPSRIKVKCRHFGTR